MCACACARIVTHLFCNRFTLYKHTYAAIMRWDLDAHVCVRVSEHALWGMDAHRQKLYPTVTTTTRSRPLLSRARFALAFLQCKEMEARAESENSLQTGIRAAPDNFCQIGRQDCLWQLGSTILQATSPSQRFTCHGSLTHRRAWLTTCNTHRSRTLRPCLMQRCLN